MGLVVFYDFVLGLDPGSQAARIVVGLYNKRALYGEPVALHAAQCGVGMANPGGNPMQTAQQQIQIGAGNVILNARQPVPR